MQNNIIILLFLLSFFCKAYANEQFAFDVSKIEISENGNKIVGSNRGLITSDNGIIIEADEFEYSKKNNLLKVSGNVIVNNPLKKYQIFSNKISYLKNEDIILAENKIKFIDNNERIINSNNFLYNVRKNIFEAKGNVKILDLNKNLEINSEKIKYSKKDQKIICYGSTDAKLDKIYEFKSSRKLTINILKDEVHALENVEFFDVLKNNRIVSDEIYFFRKKEEVITKGITDAFINNKLILNSKNISFFNQSQIIQSKNKDGRS